jgi:hypothetical protein
VITLGYMELNLIYYVTAGEMEVRCWTLYNGSLAPQAAGVIHGDFERGFIKAEVCGHSAWVRVRVRVSLHRGLVYTARVSLQRVSIIDGPRVRVSPSPCSVSILGAPPAL